MLKVGIIGLGGMGGVHFNAYKNNPGAQIVAVCDVDEAKLEGGGTQLNIGGGAKMDLTGIKKYRDALQMIDEAELDLVDICLPTSLHARYAKAALEAGIDVFCEKPIALTLDEAKEVEEARTDGDPNLHVGHCLRFWPQYVKGYETIWSGKYGKPLYARFHRSGATPTWSWDGWLQDGARSGGAVLDMHIHDVDTAYWWFGSPVEIKADGHIVNGLPMSVDANWRYEDGLLVYLHGSWDDNGGPFRMSYKVVMEKATVEWDSSKGDAVLLHQNGETQEMEVSSESAYQAEIDALIAEGEVWQLSSTNAEIALRHVLEELKQIKARN